MGNDLDAIYYKLHSDGIDTCLNCRLEICALESTLIKCPLKHQKKKITQQGRHVPPLPDDYISAEEAAQMVGIKPKSFSKRCRLGQVPGAIQINGCWVIPVEAMQDQS